MSDDIEEDMIVRINGILECRPIDHVERDENRQFYPVPRVTANEGIAWVLDDPVPIVFRLH